MPKRATSHNADVMPLRDFQRDAKTFITRMKRTRKPQVLTVAGRREAVMLDARTFESMKRDQELLESVERLRSSMHSAKEGRERPLRAAIDALCRKHHVSR